MQGAGESMISVMTFCCFTPPKPTLTYFTNRHMIFRDLTSNRHRLYGALIVDTPPCAVGDGDGGCRRHEPGNRSG
jgi:hypothetical protein